MAEYTADFEAGSNGNTITTGAGEASATAWSQVYGSPTYTNAVVAEGSLAASCNAYADGFRWGSEASEHYGRFYLRVPSFPTTNSTVADFAGCRIEILTDGTLRLQHLGGNVAGAVPISTAQWIRIEYHILHSATVGLFEVKLFNTPNSTSPSEVIGPNADRDTNASPTSYVFQWAGTAGWTPPIYYDGIVANATSYPGPVAAPAGSYTILNGSDEQLLNVNAGGTDVDAASYKDGVSLTEEELAALLDGTSFGKKNIAVLPNLTGVADARQIKKTTFSAETESA